jgi:8-oxo-dGTP pyrophosphatase MutT (NUDIX family)
MRLARFFDSASAPLRMTISMMCSAATPASGKALQPTRLSLQLPRVKKGRLVQDSDGWQTIASTHHFTNDHLEVVTDEVRTPARAEPRSWTIVRRKAAVIVAPMTRDGKIVLIRQERIPIRAAIWEMPSGQIDDHDADEDAIKKVALRELCEEAGYQLASDGELIALGHYFSSPGFTDEHGYLFLARPVEPCSQGERDEGESIVDCRAFGPEEIRRMIAENDIRDANTLGICARLAARGLLPLRPVE